MAFRSVGINLLRLLLEGVSSLADDLEALKIAGPDFAEVWPDHLGVILGGNLDAERAQSVRELLLKTDLAYTVHAPLEVNLMDLTATETVRSPRGSALIHPTS
jgi:sugar phosphate isomerase/epimerase